MLLFLFWEEGCSRIGQGGTGEGVQGEHKNLKHTIMAFLANQW